MPDGLTECSSPTKRTVQFQVEHSSSSDVESMDEPEMLVLDPIIHDADSSQELASQNMIMVKVNGFGNAGMRRTSSMETPDTLTCDDQATDGVQSRIVYPTWTTSGEAKKSMISLVSVLYCMLLIIIAMAFGISLVVVDTMNASKSDAFYIYLYLVALAFFGYCYAFLLRTEGCCGDRSPKSLISRYRGSDIDVEHVSSVAMQAHRRMVVSLKRKVTHSARSAGSLYLRLGCVVFGVVGLIEKGLRAFAAFDDGVGSVCVRGSAVAETLLSGVFIFFQMFFIFQNSKVVIHRFKTTGCVGTMHLIAANLCVWIRSLIDEQYSVIKDIRHKNHRVDEMFLSFDSRQNESERNQLPKTLSFCEQARMDDQLHQLIDSLQPFVTTCLVEYSLICSAVMYILWRNIGLVLTQRRRQRKQRFQVDCRSSTKGLFTGLLVMVFTIVVMIIFVAKSRAERHDEALWIAYAWDAVLYSVSTLAAGVAAFRVRRMFYQPRQKNLQLDDILLMVGLLGQLTYCLFAVVPLNSGTPAAAMLAVTCLLRLLQVLLQTVFIVFAQRLAAITTELQNSSPGRETVTFLLLANLSMFLINTFETQKTNTGPLVARFYGDSVWTVIVHSTLPLSTFFRFHSTVCLAEIWKEAYRTKTADVTLG